jgi:hypothetical protein
MFDGVSVVWRQADVDMLVGQVARPTWYRETSGVPGRRFRADLGHSGR